MFEISEIIFWIAIFYIIFAEDELSKSCTLTKKNKWRFKNNLQD